MKAAFVDYLKSVGIDSGDPIFRRIEQHLADYLILCPEEIKGIFVNEYVGDNEKRVYQSVCFFTDHYCMEGKNPTDPRKFGDIAYLHKRISWCEWATKDYTFNEADDKSMATLTMRFESESLQLRASKKNCDVLLKIYEDHIKPNFRNG